MNLWLDDVREPWKHDDTRVWVWVKTAADAIAELRMGNVVFASLDHDLWLCAECQRKPDMQSIGEADLVRLDEGSGFVCSCRHNGTGHDVIEWMEKNDVWPPEGVRVHSMNPVGRKRMESAVLRHYGRIW